MSAQSYTNMTIALTRSYSEAALFRVGSRSSELSHGLLTVTGCDFSADSRYRSNTGPKTAKL